MLYYDAFSTPVGDSFVVYEEENLRHIFLFAHEWQTWHTLHPQAVRHPARCATAVSQLQQYFRGERQHFHLPLVPAETPFRQRVRQAMLMIPFAQTRSYGELARLIGSAKAARAVGQACRTNPYPLVVPCHRVIASDGRLGGYAGNHTDVKDWLIRWERNQCE